jgi:hypothetical protein
MSIILTMVGMTHTRTWRTERTQEEMQGDEEVSETVASVEPQEAPETVASAEPQEAPETVASA